MIKLLILMTSQSTKYGGPEGQNTTNWLRLPLRLMEELTSDLTFKPHLNDPNQLNMINNEQL